MRIQQRLAFLLGASLVGFLGLPAPAQAQCGTPGPVCMTRTTLSANVSSTATALGVASATGFTVGNGIWVDFEQMEIVSITGTSIGVRRGQNGTRAEAHDSGDGILTGVRVGGPNGGGHFNNQDPDFGEDCTRGAAQATHMPWINVRTGWLFICDNGPTAEWTATAKLPRTLNSEPTSF